jgi:hypothetical protein
MNEALEPAEGSNARFERNQSFGDIRQHTVLPQVSTIVTKS